MNITLAGLWQSGREWLQTRRQDAGSAQWLALRERGLLLARKYEALTLRERGLLSLGIAAALLVTWDSVVMQSLYRRERAVRSQLDIVAPPGSESDVTLTDLDHLVALERDYTKKYNEKWAELQGKAATLIEPSRMSEVLTELIDATRGIRLVRLANLPVEELRSSPAALEPAEGGTITTAASDELLAGQSTVPAVAYVHGLEIIVDGNYQSIHDYLRAVESQRWRFIWRKAELDATDYPAIRARIVVATLGLDKYWLAL